jgi:acyl-coenzyme A synthetase/AMP-(fatty) acid ligase
MTVSLPTVIPLPALSDNALIPLINGYEPSAVFAYTAERTITQGEFIRDVMAMADALCEAPHVFNLCEDRYGFLVVFCALLVKGATNLLPPNRHASTLEDLARDYPHAYCVTDRPLTTRLPLETFADLLARAVPPVSATLPHIAAQHIAAIAFTSGSTGTPKPNAKAFGTLAATARLLGQRLAHHTERVMMVGTVPSQHMYGLETTVFMALQANVILHAEKPFYPKDVQQVLLAQVHPVLLVTTPIHLRALVNAELSMPALHGIISATAPLDRTLAHTAEALFATSLHEIYGCTEAGSMATRHSTRELHWQPLDGFVMESRGEEGADVVAPHLAGRVLIQDQLLIDETGTFLLQGRNADMINVAGKRASLAQLTLELLRIDGVTDAAIFLPPTHKTAECRPVGMVVTSRPLADISSALSQRIDAAFIPRPLRAVHRIERNETGKATQASLHAQWNALTTEVSAHD